MKVSEILSEGKVSPAWRKKYKARIMLSSQSWGAPPSKDKDKRPSTDAKAAAYKSAKAKFDQAVEEHPDGLCFASLTLANAHMKSMEYPGWTMNTVPSTGYGGSKRADPIDYTYQDATVDDIKVEDIGDGKCKVSVAATTGPTLSALLSVFYKLYKYKRFNKNGEELSRTGTFRANTFIVKAPLGKVQAAIYQVKTDLKFQEDEKIRKASPEYKREVNQANAAYRKEREAEMAAKFGQEYLDRVKIRSMSHEGDDGHQWAVFVDGRRTYDGLTKYSAMSQREAVMINMRNTDMLNDFLTDMARVLDTSVKKVGEWWRGHDAPIDLHSLHADPDSLDKKPMNPLTQKVLDMTGIDMTDVVERRIGQAARTKIWRTVLKKLGLDLAVTDLL